VYVLADMKLKLRILEAHHDRKMASHLRQNKRLEQIVRNYIWPGMREFVNEYIRTCDACARNKIPHCRRHGQLYSLLILTGPWKSVSIDFIV